MELSSAKIDGAASFCQIMSCNTLGFVLPSHLARYDRVRSANSFVRATWLRSAKSLAPGVSALASLCQGIAWTKRTIKQTLTSNLTQQVLALREGTAFVTLQTRELVKRLWRGRGIACRWDAAICVPAADCVGHFEFTYHDRGVEQRQPMCADALKLQMAFGGAADQRKRRGVGSATGNAFDQLVDFLESHGIIEHVGRESLLGCIAARAGFPLRSPIKPVRRGGASTARRGGFGKVVIVR